MLYYGVGEITSCKPHASFEEPNEEIWKILFVNITDFEYFI
jgi:hypothetical protein